MLYVSRLWLNPRSRQAMAEVANPYNLHRTLTRALSDGEEYLLARLLFRVEDRMESRTPWLLVQTLCPPDWGYLAEHPGYLLRPVEEKSVEPAVRQGQRWRFRLRANPTKRLPGRQAVDAAGKMKDGPRVQLFHEEDQLAWLARQGAQHGFALVGCQVSGVEMQHSRKAIGPEMHHQAVTFDGLLQITDLAAFRMALEGGIGPGKGLGFGLLSVAR